MRFMAKTHFGSAQLNQCDRVFIGAVAIAIGALPHISDLADHLSLRRVGVDPEAAACDCFGPMDAMYDQVLRNDRHPA
jgi:hypothetical protein